MITHNKLLKARKARKARQQLIESTLTIVLTVSLFTVVLTSLILNVHF